MLDLLLGAVLAYQEFIVSLLAPQGDALAIASGADSLANQIRAFIAPLALIACSIFALIFLVQRQFTQMLIFIVIAVIVFAIFYVPEMLSSLGTSIGEANSNLSWD